MAFSSTITAEGKTVQGNKRVVLGTYVSDGGSTGGDIATGLNKVEAVFLQSTGAAVAANAPSVNETLPLMSGTVTIVTDANASGCFRAEGL
jgi:hypothetical protein